MVKIMFCRHQPQSFFQIIEMLHADSFSHQAGDAVSPLVVQAFNHTGFAVALCTGPMLPCVEELGIGMLKIRIHQLAAIRRRHLKPQLLQRFFTSVTHAPSQHLMRESRNHQPQITIAPLKAIADHQLIDLQSITRNRRQKRVGKTQTALPRLF